MKIYENRIHNRGGQRVWSRRAVVDSMAHGTLEGEIHQTLSSHLQIICFY